MFLCNALQYYGVLVLAFNILFKVYKRQIKKSSMFVLGLQKYHFLKNHYHHILLTSHYL